jgi:glycosyltransferase involved in cell wall biosynthesis
MLRFVKYLPEFGWRPIVLTINSKACGHLPLDPALRRQVPDETAVAQTAVWRPAARLRSLMVQWRKLRGADGATEERNGEEQTSGGNTRPGRSSLLRAADQLAKIVFETPDADIGWAVPAILAARRLIREHRPSVILSTGPPHSSHLVALAVKVLASRPVVLDFRDPWARGPDSEKRSSVQNRIVQMLERRCVENSDHVILNTPRLCSEFQGCYPRVQDGRFSVVPNGYEPEALRGIATLMIDRPDRRASSPLRVCHAGAIYGRRDLRPVIEAVAQLAGSGTRVHFEQIGSISHARREELAACLRGRDLDGCVTLTRRLPHDQALVRMADADVLAVIQPGMPTQVPGKLYEMLMFRKPIVALTDGGATADMMNKFRLGAVADPHDPASIAAAMIRAGQIRERRETTAEWSDALDEFDGRKLTGRLAGLLEKVARSG